MGPHRPEEPFTVFFSPSIARVAASTVGDWSCVESWFASTYVDRSLIDFERNHSTLKALIDLINFSETGVDSHRSLVDTEAFSLLKLRQLRQEQGIQQPGRQDGTSPLVSDVRHRTPAWALTQSHYHSLKDCILHIIQCSLGKEGAASLQLLAAMATCIGISSIEPKNISCAMSEMQNSFQNKKQEIARPEALQRHISGQALGISNSSAISGQSHYHMSFDLDQRNRQFQRRTRATFSQPSGPPDFLSNDSTSAGVRFPSVDHITSEERHYLALVACQKECALKLAAFQGLPSELHQTRAEIDFFHRRLQEVTSRRDILFEGLVELESPIKHR